MTTATTTSDMPVAGAAGPAGPARVLRDTWTITRRDLDHWIAQPAPVAINLLFPVMTVLMFGYLFGGALSVLGGGSYREFLMPGMFAMTMLFGMEITMAAVVTDASAGVTDRFRSLPMASSAVLLGRGTADMLNAVLGLAVMVGCGLAVGWQARQGFGPTLAAVGLLLLLRYVHHLLLRRGDNGRAFLKIMRSFETTEEKTRLYSSVLAPEQRPVQLLWGRDDPALLARRHGLLAAQAVGLGEPVLLPGRHFVVEDSADRIADAVARLISKD